ncbi:VOC family protein [Streptomyces cavernicola]|uniref:VOC family protein n=1 Tax=Streptomyces cavernicola TaxID=3043613 RepID=A0ABT6SCW7_9ACTN|nr:VOC family protein [Streptomyces sp. B-S-A6]MDI3406033.1 VOC family protein [Streptomyces sp. B-S-A6]
MAARTHQQMVFINLAVKDIELSKKFFGEVGYELNPQFSDDETACVAVSDSIVLMLLQEEKFARFTVKPVADATRSTEALICLSAGSRRQVDELVDRALSAGGSPAAEPSEMGFMYGRSFLDPDGHHFEVMWMDENAVQGC